MKLRYKPLKAFVLKNNGTNMAKFHLTAAQLLIARKPNGLNIKLKYKSQGYKNNK
jgi:hypothetical protein